MEDWQIDFEWLRVRHLVKDAMGQDGLPDLQIILLLIGVQEAGVLKPSYTKEEKQDLMHVATCQLLSTRGYFEFVGMDDEGWPHYKQIKTVAAQGEKAQESLLKQCIISYFSDSSKLAFHEN